MRERIQETVKDTAQERVKGRVKERVKESTEQENVRLKRALSGLIKKAGDNQRILEHFQAFELELLSCRSLNTLLETILEGTRRHFDLEACRLLWFDPEYGTRELLDFEQWQGFDGVLEFASHHGPFEKIYGDSYTPVLKPLSEVEKARWFPWVHKVESCAMLPLLRQDTLVGSLHMGSATRDRFTPDKAVDFMQRLASIMALCLESCVNHEHLRRLSLIDTLTRVKNRRSFDQDLSKELSRTARSFKPLSCLFIDIDHFKKVNDRYGHQAGDNALKTAAQVIGKQLRQTDHLARYGGEEFAALLPDCDKAMAMQIAERVRMAAEQHLIRCDGVDPFRVTLSIGISTWNPSPKEPSADEWVGQRLVAKADSAVYEAKRQGRNRVCFQCFDELVPVVA